MDIRAVFFCNIDSYQTQYQSWGFAIDASIIWINQMMSLSEQSASIQIYANNILCNSGLMRRFVLL